MCKKSCVCDRSYNNCKCRVLGQQGGRLAPSLMAVGTLGGTQREEKRDRVCLAEGNAGTSAKTSMARLDGVSLNGLSKTEYEEGR